MWTNYFDKIFVINLPDHVDRLLKTLRQLQGYEIEVEVFQASDNDNGAVGLRETMIRLFTECLEKCYSNILVFEDDISIIEDLNKYMPLCLQQLPHDYDLLYLGAYVIRPFKERHSANLFLLDKALTTHAVAYPQKTIEKVLKLFNTHNENPRDVTTIDMILLNRVLSEGKSYISYPLLVTQRQGFSKIQNKEVDYKKYIEEEYLKQINDLK